MSQVHIMMSNLAYTVHCLQSVLLVLLLTLWTSYGPNRDMNSSSY